jgi:glucokinase
MAQGRAEEFALVADIGGTNARFALAPLRSGGLVDIRRWRVASFATLSEAARAFIDEVGVGRNVRVGAIAVAAATNKDEIRCTNCDWRFSVAALRGELGFDELHVINDFAANSWALPEVGKSEIHAIAGEARNPAAEGTYAVLGPGTGLGVGAVHIDSDGHATVLETEGGHVDFAPCSEEEDRLVARLRSRYGRVSYERLICGKGLVNLYDALTDSGTEMVPEEITARMGSDPQAARAVAMFCEILGSFAGNAALMYGAWNGVYLAGGLLRPMLDTLRSGGFKQRFSDKGRFGPLLAEVPTMLIEHPSLGLLGAAASLRERLRR